MGQFYKIWYFVNKRLIKVKNRDLVILLSVAIMSLIQGSRLSVKIEARDASKPKGVGPRALVNFMVF